MEDSWPVLGRERWPIWDQHRSNLSSKTKQKSIKKRTLTTINKLKKEVEDRGGYLRVEERREWRQIARSMGVPAGSGGSAHEGSAHHLDSIEATVAAARGGGGGRPPLAALLPRRRARARPPAVPPLRLAPRPGTGRVRARSAQQHASPAPRRAAQPILFVGYLL